MTKLWDEIVHKLEVRLVAEALATTLCPTCYNQIHHCTSYHEQAHTIIEALNKYRRAQRTSLDADVGL